MAKETCLCLCLFFTSSLSFKYFQSKIPNGDSIPHPCKPNYLWHGFGHRNELGGGSRNPFGEVFDAAGKTWTHELCRKDSDGDGKTNGEELGDPNCIWWEYAIPDENAISHPGVYEPFNSSLCRPKNTWVQCELETFKCDAINQPGVKNITLRYPQTKVPFYETSYFCLTFELPNDGDYHLIATTPNIDNEYVMHHILLYGCDDSVTNETTVPTICGMVPDSCLTIIGGWTVGTHGECAHKDVGFRIGKNGFKSAILQYFQSKIPNGDSVPHPCKPNYLWHGVGHRNELGGGSRNPFGEDFDAAGKTWTQGLCRKDSDGDGKTNGEELGDPNCVWRENAIPDTNAFSHPGVCEPYNSDLCRLKNTWVQCELETFKCDAIKQPDVMNTTLKYPQTQVPSLETSYFCMTFELPDDGDYHMIATTPYIDNEYVMHHIVLYGCDDSITEKTTVPAKCEMVSNKCRTIIGAWAVGFRGECAHKDVGFRIGQNGFKFAMMQFHWNNPERRSDYVDSSGMTLYYTPNRRPNDAAIMSVGQEYLEIPPGKERVEVDASCTGSDTKMTLTGPVYITRAFNHMHYLGREEYIDQYRNGVKINTLTNEPDYSYDRPRFLEYDSAIELLPGDELRTKCVFKSSSKSFTTFKGDATSDEMCYGFLTVHPITNIKITTCASFKSISTLKLTSRQVINGCDLAVFSNYSNPDMAELYGKVSQRCMPLSKCLEECKEAVKEFKRHPCMQGEMGEMIRWYGQQSLDVNSLTFYSKLDSCDLEILREDMLNQMRRDTNDGSQVFPQFLMMVLLLIFIFI